MNETTERILIEALDMLEQGVGVDEIVGRYPAQAAELRPFLLTAAALSNVPHQPTLTAASQSKRAFLDAADAAATQPANAGRATGGWLRRLMAPTLAVLLIVFLGGAGLVSASGAAVPGDALYDTKRFVEEVRLNLTTNPETAAELREQFRLERVSEVDQLLAEGRAAAVSFSGEIEAMDGERWSVAGVPVLVASATAIDGLPVVGALAQVDGLTSDGAVIANRVTVLSAGPAPAPTPVDTQTPAPSPTRPSTPRPSATVPDDDDDDDAPVVPLPGSQPGALPTTGPTAAPIAQPTSPPPAPTAVPPPTATPDDDGDDDDDDDNANDDDDDDGGGSGGDDANDNGGDDDAGDNSGSSNENTDDNADNADDSDNDGGADDNDNENNRDDADDSDNDGSADDDDNDNSGDDADDADDDDGDD